MATAAHPLHDPRELVNPNVVKVVLDNAGYALYFSRSPVPFARDAFAHGIRATGSNGSMKGSYATGVRKIDVGSSINEHTYDPALL